MPFSLYFRPTICDPRMTGLLPLGFSFEGQAMKNTTQTFIVELMFHSRSDRGRPGYVATIKRDTRSHDVQPSEEPQLWLTLSRLLSETRLMIPGPGTRSVAATCRTSRLSPPAAHSPVHCDVPPIHTVVPVPDRYLQIYNPNPMRQK